MRPPLLPDRMNLHSSQRNNRSGMTLIEIMAMLAVVGLTLLTMFQTLTQTITFSRDAESRIRAINIAREGIEAMVNIRNTNWLMFTSDRTNCWDTLNYDIRCVGNTTHDKINEWDYILYDQDGLWWLSGSSTPGRLGVTPQWWYSWSGGYSSNRRCLNIGGSGGTGTTDCLSNFTRHITVSDKTSTGMTVTATVAWRSTTPRSVSLTHHITNWKSHYQK